VAEEPEQVLPQERRAAALRQDFTGDEQSAGDKEAGAGVSIEPEQRGGAHQHGERQQRDRRAREPAPARQRHPPERHSRCPAHQHGGEEIERVQRRSHTEHRDARDPQVHAAALARTGARAERAERRIRGPTSGGRAALDEESTDENREGRDAEPRRKRAEPRQRRAGRAELQGQHVVAEAADRRRGQHEEHHDGAVHRDQRQVELGRHRACRRGCRQHALEPPEIVRRIGELPAHDQRQRHPDHQRQHREREIAQTDALVVTSQEEGARAFHCEAAPASQALNAAAGSASSTPRMR
jgi:hypothetical protein